MRVMLVAPYFPPEVTGSSNFVRDLAHGLSQLGHEVCVVTATQNVDEADFNVVSLKSRIIKPGRIAFDYAIPTVLSRSNLREIRRLFLDFRPEVVSLHGQIFDITLIAGLFARRSRIPTVMTVHSAIWHDRRAFDLLLGVADRILALAALRRVCDHWIAVDGRTRQHIFRRYSRKRVSLIPICVRRGSFAEGDSEVARTQYGVSGQPLLASIGHVVPVRDRVRLVEALPILLREFPNLELVVVGRVADDTFLTRAAELGVMSHLRVVGAVPHSDIAHILAACDLEVHDIQGFGLGIASLEPIDAGVPIVAYVRNDNLDGIDLHEICPEGLMPDNRPETIASLIQRVLSDGDFRKQLMAGQKELLEKVYYLDVVAEKYVKVFDELLRS